MTTMCTEGRTEGRTRSPRPTLGQTNHPSLATTSGRRICMKRIGCARRYTAMNSPAVTGSVFTSSEANSVSRWVEGKSKTRPSAHAQQRRTLGWSTHAQDGADMAMTAKETPPESGCRRKSLADFLL